MFFWNSLAFPMTNGCWQFDLWFLCLFQFQFSSVQSLSRVRLFATPWTTACQASLSITNSWSLLKVMSIKLVMPFNHLILWCSLLLPPSSFPSIRVFSIESVLCIRWAKYWSFSFSISPSNEYPGLISFRINWFDLLAVQGTLRSLVSGVLLISFYQLQHSEGQIIIPYFMYLAPFSKENKAALWT